MTTATIPAGVDTLSNDDRALYDAMRSEDGAAQEATIEEPAASEAAPEIEIEDHDAPVAEEARAKTVPHAQFHAMNERRKEAERRAQEAESKSAAELARADERLKMLAAAVAVNAPQAQSPAVDTIEVPDVNIDPVGHFAAQLKLRDRELADMKAILHGSQEQAQQQRQIAELRQWGAAQETAFQAKEPTYPEAMKFLEQSRHAELEQIGITDPAERARIIGMDVHNIAIRSRQEGADFADRLFKVAKARGFQKAPVVPALDASAAVDAAARIESGRDNALSLGSVGAAPPARLSAEKIANMDEKQFAALLNRMKGNPTALRDLMGN